MSGGHALTRHREARLSQSARECGHVAGRPRGPDAIRPQRPSYCRDTGRVVQAGVRGIRHRVRSVIHVEEHGVERRTPLHGGGDVAHVKHDSRIVQGMRGQWSEHATIPFDDRRNQLRDRHECRGRQLVESGPERKTHAQTGHEHAWRRKGSSPPAADERQRGFGVVRTTGHERVTICENGHFARVRRQHEFRAARSRRAFEHAPGFHPSSMGGSDRHVKSLAGSWHVTGDVVSPLARVACAGRLDDRHSVTMSAMKTEVVSWARRLSIVAAAAICTASLVAQAPVTIDLEDVLAMPMTGSFAGGTGNPGVLARVNFMRPEPGNSGRVFINDLNGPLYIYEPSTGALVTYLDFNGRDRAPGLFRRFTFAAGFANGLISFQFDPDYAANGRFYTLHLEDPAVAAAPEPDASRVPGLLLPGYAPTATVRSPGAGYREDVLIEWTDSNIHNSTFEGTARELLRVNLHGQIHPIGDMVFNPSARRGDPDFGVMYIGAGDGGSGEQKPPDVRSSPQRLDTLVGKILRIIPDVSSHVTTSALSANGRYRIPADNPFVKTAGARPEIWAYGFRNPHRLTWEADPARPANQQLLAMSIGLHSWETVNVVHKGANYGYSETEGAEQLLAATNATGPLPKNLRLPIRVSDTRSVGTTRSTFPVLAYNHTEGLAIMGGFVYRGTKIPALRGRFVFGDIPSGRLWYADYAEMLRADDGKPETMAAKHPIMVRWDDPTDVPDAGARVFTSVNAVVVAAYEARKRRATPASTAPMPARADIRFGFDGTGEFFILSKVDGMIRRATVTR